MSLFVHFVLGRCGEPPFANGATIWLFASVCASMFLQIAFLRKPFGTMRTLKRFVTIMQFDVLYKRSFVGKQLSAHLARILFFARVRPSDGLLSSYLS